MTTNALNALMFGAKDDALWLAKYTPELHEQLMTLDIDDDIPEGMVDVGWISDEGTSLAFNDSVEKIRGHQANGIVRTFMSESDTTFEATAFESLLETVSWYLDSVVTRETGSKGTVHARYAQRSSRSVVRLVGVWDAFDSANDVHVRLVFPLLELGSRDSIPFKVKELTAYKLSLEVLGEWFDLSDSPGMLPAADGPAVAPKVTGVTPANAAEGATITIAGTDLTGATGVTVGGTAATNVVVVSPTSVTAKVPAGTAGSAPVVITTPGGTSTAFAYTRGA